VNETPPGSIVLRGGCDLAGGAQDVHVVDGLVTEAGAAPRVPSFDVTGCFVAPGYVDLQVNGAQGIDLTGSPELIWEVAAVLPRFGVTSFLPTIVTAPPATIDQALAAFAAGAPDGWRGARPLGLHLEGPMIAPGRAGAHATEAIALPSAGLATAWSRDAGVAMVTLAPELPGAGEVIAGLARSGIVVAAGHTDATASDARAGVAAGLTMVTHLFNAMAPLHHRTESLAAAVLSDLPIAASLIVDGTHVSPSMVRLAWRALGPERRILVSDAVAALGASPGRYRLAGIDIVWNGRSCTTTGGALAGAGLGLDACVRNVVAITECAPTDAVRAATMTPADLLGRSDLGRLDVGALGDVVVLDADLDVVMTIVGGVVVYRRGHR
jgi:N-acetylglucosamine-6-phosphate deacetylase